MEDIPFFDSYDSDSSRLTLRGATHLPREIFKFKDQIEILDAGSGSLSELPDNLPELHNLRILFLSNTNLTEVPRVLADCKKLLVAGFKSCKICSFPEDSLPKNLKWLILTGNTIEQIPKSIGKLKSLRKLALAGNRISSVPDELQNCESLELLRLGANNLSLSPRNLITKLQKLAWYSDSGNPFSIKHSSLEILAGIPFDQIVQGGLIGKSPTSEVFRGRMLSTGEEIAVKYYRGILTSDGYAEDDLRAMLIAGTHPNLIKAIGPVSSAPQGKMGVVLKLIPDEYFSPGLPPDFESCTRDRLNPGMKFSPKEILHLLRDISLATCHLHEKGIMHGDLYLHNILTNESGQSILGDFGAASLYDRNSDMRLEKIESSAFGYLIDDLSAFLGKDCSISAGLRALSRECLSLELSKRPDFREISNQLNKLA